MGGVWKGEKCLGHAFGLLIINHTTFELQGFLNEYSNVWRKKVNSLCLNVFLPEPEPVETTQCFGSTHRSGSNSIMAGLQCSRDTLHPPYGIKTTSNYHKANIWLALIATCFDSFDEIARKDWHYSLKEKSHWHYFGGRMAIKGENVATYSILAV